MSQAAGGAADGCGIAGGTGGNGEVRLIRGKSYRAVWFSLSSGRVHALPSSLLFIYDKDIHCSRAHFPHVRGAQSAPRRSGRSRVAVDKNKVPVGRIVKNHAYWKDMERHWLGWSAEDRDAKMAETFQDREAAREEFEAEQMEMKDEWWTSGWCAILILRRRQPHR